MSADLWAAFGASDDLSTNPWIQTSPAHPRTRGDQSAADQRSFVSSGTEKTSIELSTQQGSQTPWASSHAINSVHESSLASLSTEPESWSTLRGGEDEIWSGWENPTASANAWAVKEVSPKAVPKTAHQVEGPSQTEDWGDFETPHDDLTEGIAALGVQEEIKSLPKSYSARAREQKKEAFRESNPYANMSGPESLSKSTQSDLEEFKAIRPPTILDNGESAPTNKAVPYTEEEWGEFSPEPLASPNLTNKALPKPRSSPRSSINSKQDKSRVLTHTEVNPIASKEGLSSALPPSNIPPPSILISLVTGLIEKLPAQVETAMQSFSVSTGSDKALETALHKCLASLRVAARISAGRKLRWKRDNHLAQSMRIGQAGKGMKLSSVDRNETRKEDREAAEFVHIWKKRLGSIRKALAMVNSQVAARPLALPDISETMAVRTVKTVDGGIPAPKSCVLCGIKREERVDKVDADIYDVFGEWWTDHWGHTDCRMFWIEHERYLQQR